MRKFPTSLLLCVAAGLLVAEQIHAQNPTSPGCGPNITNSIQSLLGTWIYSVEGTSPSGESFRSAGQFVASLGLNKSGLPIGLLTITNSQSQNGSITRMETDSGSYQVSGDCSGGLLVFNLSSRPLQFDLGVATLERRLTYTN